MNINYLKDLYRSRTTVIEMLENRGYSFNNTIKEMDFEEFKELSNQDIIDDDEKIYVNYVHSNIKLNTDVLENIIEKINEEYEEILIIIVYTNAISQILKKEIQGVQLFNLNEVIINKSNHIYSNKHVIIEEKEINELLDKYKITIDKLPHILYTDAMVKYIGASVGNVVKIERTSKSTGKYYYYRLCV